jgi:endonuclease/exonuclease/phosphatase family metal-dependent hydrolase
MNSLTCRLRILAVLAFLSVASVFGRQDGTAGLGAAASQAPGATTVRIASLNMEGKLDSETAFREFDRSEHLLRTDILLLQEVDGDRQKRRDLIDGLSGSLGLPFVHVPDEAIAARPGCGLAVLSRFAMKETAVIHLKHFKLVYHLRDRIALVQTVETPLGDVRLFDLHLDARLNPGDRLDQLSSVLDAADKDTRPVIIGGDFNTGDFYWGGHVLPFPGKRNQRGALLNSMAGRGYQTPFESTGPTHDRLGLQLDWMFFRRLRPMAAGTQPIDFSDHHAIWAEIGPDATPGVNRAGRTP